MTAKKKSPKTVKLPKLTCPLATLTVAYDDVTKRIKWEHATRMLRMRNTSRLEKLGKTLGLPPLFLLETGIEAWLKALENDSHNGLTFPVRIQTQMPGDY